MARQDHRKMYICLFRVNAFPARDSVIFGALAHLRRRPSVTLLETTLDTRLYFGYKRRSRSCEGRLPDAILSDGNICECGAVHGWCACRRSASLICLSMILSENRCPFFGIMLWWDFREACRMTRTLTRRWNEFVCLAFPPRALRAGDGNAEYG
jgi:hypothetical protein